MKENIFIFNHIAEFISILNDLDRLDVKIEDDQAFLLLCSLPASYKAFRDMMINSREKIIFEDVKSTLQVKLHLDNEITNVEKGSQCVGLVVDQVRSWHKTPKKGRIRSKLRYKYLTCNYCKKEGHIKADFLS
jgi:gag-polypeptide of LTR copia-type